MTAPRAFTRTISDAMRRTLATLGDEVKPKNPRLFSRISDVLQDETASETRALALIEQAKRVTGARPNPDAEAVNELSRRANPSADGRLRGWDPEVAKTTRGKSAIATVLDGAEVEGGGKPVGGKSTPESRAAARAERSQQNRARAEKRRQDIAAAGKDPEAIKRINEAYDAETARLSGGAGRSVQAQSGAIGTGPKAEAKEVASAARRQVNADLRAKKIDAAEAEKRYAIIKQQEQEAVGQLRTARSEGDLNTQTKVGDAQDIKDGRYYDIDNPEAMDRPIISGTRKLGMRPGGLNERVVTASAVVRRHINEMIARGEIPAAPPDAAMPSILRTALKEMGTDDTPFDDHALMRAYRQQARRGSAFSRRRELTDPADLPGVDSIDEAGERAGLKMLEDMRGGRARRPEAEEGFVDNAAAMLAEGDAFEDPVLPDVGPTGRQLARATQQATMVPPPEDASFRQRESFRRGRNRAERQANQFDRMDEGAGEYAAERNAKREKARNAVTRTPKPREFFLQDELGPIVQPGQAKKTIVPGAGQVRQNTAPGQFHSKGVGGELSPENMRLRDRGEAGFGREQVFPTTRQRPGVNDPEPIPGPEPRMGQQGPNFAIAAPESPEMVMRQVQDENTALLGMVESGQLTKEQAAGYMMDNMRRIERVYAEAGGRDLSSPPMESGGGWQQGGRPDTQPPPAPQASEFTARRTSIDEQANQDIDGLVRMLMERVSRMPQGEQDQFFALPPRGLDQQLMLNRDRSRTMRETMRPEVDYRGEPLDIGRPDAVPFPSRMGRQFPQDRDVQSIVEQVLAAINAGR